MGKYTQKLGGKYKKMLAAPRGNTDFPTQTAQPASTMVAPSVQEQPDGDGVLKQILNALSPPGAVTPLQRAEGIGTIAEIALPTAGMLAGVGWGSVPLTAALAATASQLKDRLIESAGGVKLSEEERGKRALESGIYGGVGQALGVGAGKVLQKAAAPMAKYVEPQSLAAAKKMGIDYLPSEILAERGVTPSLMQGMERVAGSTVTGGAVLNPVRMGRVLALKDFAKSELDRAITILDDPANVKKLAESGLQATKSAFNAASNKIYREVGNLAKGSGVNTKMMKQYASSVLGKIPQAERIAAGSAGREATDLVSQLERITLLPDAIPFQDAQFYRSQLLDLARSAEGPIANRVVGSGKKLSQIFESRMRVTAKAGGFLPEYEAANKFYAEGVQKFHNTFIKRLADVEPGKLADEIFKPNNAETVREIRSAVGETAFRGMKRQGVENWFESAVRHESAGGEQYVGAKPLLDAWKNLGKETKSVVFTPIEQTQIGGLIESISKFSTRYQSPGLWGLTQIFGGGVAAGTGDITTAGAIFLAPYGFAKLITSSGGRKWLTEGLKIRPGTKQAINFMSRFSAWLAKENQQK